jgi:hypothetical protein
MLRDAGEKLEKLHALDQEAREKKRAKYGEKSKLFNRT